MRDFNPVTFSPNIFIGYLQDLKSMELWCMTMASPLIVAQAIQSFAMWISSSLENVVQGLLEFSKVDKIIVLMSNQ